MSTVVDSASYQGLRNLRVQLDPLLLHQIDGRGSSVNIPARTIVLSLGLYFLEESVTSLNKLDQKLRKAEARNILGLSPYQSSDNAPAVSDSTIRQALEGWSKERIRAVADWLYLTLREKGLLGRTLPSGLVLPVGSIDSSSFGDCYCNCITAITDSDTYPLDLESHEGFKRGKELPAARALIPRWAGRFAFLLFDGVYLKRWVFDTLQGPDKADVLVKYPIKEDRKIGFDWPLDQAQFMIQKGLRETHTIQDFRYDEPVVCHRVSFQDGKHEFLVDRFSIDVDGKQDFFTVSTRLDLSVEDTLSLSHDRFGGIENQGFRALSLQNDSKDQRPKGGVTLPPPVKCTLLFWLLLFQSFFRLMTELFVSEDELRSVKVTESWLYSCVRKYVEALFNGPRGDP